VRLSLIDIELVSGQLSFLITLSRTEILATR
jgi:hypothetical protein